MPDRTPNGDVDAEDVYLASRNLETTRRFGPVEAPSSDDAGEPPISKDPPAVTTNEDPGETEPKRGSSILGAFESLSSGSAKTEKDGAGASPAAKGSETKQPTEVSENIPTSIDLPDVTQTNPVALASLSAERIDLELISDANTSKSKSFFELKGNQAFDWSVDLRRGKNSSPVSVGTISVDDDNLLKFSWSPEAANQNEAPFLANSILKVSDGLSSTQVNLRKPIAIKGFQLSPEDPQVRIDLKELKFLPYNAKAELMSLDEKEYGAVYLGEREDSTFTQKSPMLLNFRELPEYQLLFLWLAADLKKRPRLEASLQLQINPSRRSRLATEKSVEAAKKFLDNSMFEVKQNHDYLKTVKIDEHRKRYNLSKERYKDEQRRADVKQLKEQLDLSENRFKAFREIQTQLESFYNKPLPVTVYFDVQDQRVVLATTVSE